MCNTITKQLMRIPEEGIGWKLFGYDPYISEDASKLLIWYNFMPYQVDKDKWIRWKYRYCGDKGFCFFLDEPTARIVYSFCTKSHTLLRKIQYKKGLALQEVDNFLPDREGTINVALCLEFKPLY